MLCATGCAPSGGCGGGPLSTTTLSATEACAIAACGAVPSSANVGELCRLDSAYESAFMAANPKQPASGFDCSGSADAGSNAPNCPSYSASVSYSCYRDCTGRFTEGQPRADAKGEARGEDSSADAVARRFADDAYGEACAVAAFLRMERELRAHGAPSSLIAAAARSADEERRHVEVIGALAGAPVRAVADDAPVRSLLELAIENAREGCVREAFGAALAVYRAAHATDEAIARAMASIAEDECRHAELSIAVDRWAASRLDDAANAAIAEARANERRRLIDEVSSPMPTALRERLGWPTADVAIALAALVA